MNPLGMDLFLVLLVTHLLWDKQEQHDGNKDIGQRRPKRQNPAGAALDLSPSAHIAVVPQG